MDKLYPIIRRQRRPLVVEPLPPVNAEPPKVLSDGHQIEQADKPKSSDGENPSKSETE
jgi:hypothetical protein